MNIKFFVIKNKLNFSILLFILMFSLLHYMKPSIIYNKKGGFREFGVGYKSKTVLPIWGFAIILAIISYLLVSYYILFY